MVKDPGNASTKGNSYKKKFWYQHGAIWLLTIVEAIEEEGGYERIEEGTSQKFPEEG